jgi:hypothetical protein
MSIARASEVQRLSEIALNAMGDDVRDATSTEVISAVLSLCMSSMLAVQDHHGNMEAFREPLARLYALLPPLRLN